MDSKNNLGFISHRYILLYYVSYASKINWAPKLSAADIETLEYVESLTNKVPYGNNIEVIEGIITRHEIAFYSYDTNKKKLNRLPLFINGKEIIPSTEQGLIQAFKNGFALGRQK